MTLTVTLCKITKYGANLIHSDPNTHTRKPHSALYMRDTAISSVQIMQPQYRNRHNFMIFGGFLLKTTFELAFTCASSLSHTRPTFLALDPSTFQNPVPVGSVLYLTATAAYSDSPLVDGFGDIKASPKGSTRIQIRVDSKVRNIEHGETKPTGTFNYTVSISFLRCALNCCISSDSTWTLT
jgi:acyl-coenzyme A thioesterase 9